MEEMTYTASATRSQRGSVPIPKSYGKWKHVSDLSCSLLFCSYSNEINRRNELCWMEFVSLHLLHNDFFGRYAILLLHRILFGRGSRGASTTGRDATQRRAERSITEWGGRHITGNGKDLLGHWRRRRNQWLRNWRRYPRTASMQTARRWRATRQENTRSLQQYT